MALSPNQLRAEYPFISDPTVPFANRDELTAAMMSAKYASDETYRSIVEARMQMTDRSALALSEVARQLRVTLAPPVELTRDDPDFGPEQGDQW